MRKGRPYGVSVGISLLFACGGPAGEATKVDPAKAGVGPVAVQVPVVAVEDGKQAATQPVAVDAATQPVVDGKQVPPKPADAVITAPVADGRLGAEEPAGTGFWLAAGRYGDITLADLGSEFVVAGAGVMAHVGASGALELMPDVHRGLMEPRYADGLTMLTLGGHWPDTLWMSADLLGERSESNPMMYYRKGERWQRKATKVGLLEWYYGAYAPYSDGQTLGLRLAMPAPDVYYKYSGEFPAAVQKKIDATTRANVRLDVLVGGEMKPSPMQIAAGGTPIHFTALPTGEVFVLLSFIDKVGDEQTTRYAVQRFTPGVVAGVVDPLAKLADKPLDLYKGRLVARAADDVYLVGGIDGDPANAGLVARFDGKQWAAIAAPPGSNVTWLALGANKEMWALAGRPQPKQEDTKVLWKRVGEGPWTEVVLPEVRMPVLTEPRWSFHLTTNDWDEVPADPVEAAKPNKVDLSEVHVYRDEVWVLGELSDMHYEDYTRQVVLRSKPVTRVLELPDVLFLAGELRTAKATAFDPEQGCEAGPGWVPVATLAPGAAADAAAPIAAAFLAGLTPDGKSTLTSLREVEVRGRRVLALTFHLAEQHTELLAAAQRFRPDEQHKVECWSPRPIRTFYEEPK